MAVFVGRARELAALEAALDRACSGQGGMVLLKGDAGAGKSTLVRQFLLDAALSRPQLRVLSGECSEQFGAGEPYQPFVEAFRELVREPEREQPAGRRRLRDIAKQVAPYWLQVIPVAGDIISAATSTAGELRRAFASGTATAVVPNEETLFFQYTELLLAAAEQQPILLFLDDLHWADRASVGLLGHIGRRVADQRILILGTYREADVVASQHPLRQAKLELQRYGAATEFALEPLEAGALSDFVREELGSPAAPDLMHWLSPRAGSTPLFFGELLRWLSAQGLLELKQGELSLARIPAEIEIPRTAEAIIEKRLLRLDEDGQKIVEYASVFGGEFDSVSLSRLLGMDELELEEALERLAKVHQLIRLEETRDLPTGDLASIYTFSHSLVQHAVHKGVQGKRRILLHRKVAEILEATYAADTGPVAHRLAIHFDEGRLGERAFAFALQAADVAARLYAHWSIVELLQVALRNAGSDAQRLEVLDRLAESNRALGRFPDALQLIGEAESIAVSLGARERALGLRRKRLMVERDCGVHPPPELLRILGELEREARELGASAELCEILWQYRKVPGALDQVGPAQARAEEARTLVGALANRTLAARAEYELGVVLLKDRTGDAIPAFERATRLYEETGERDEVGRCQNAAGIARIRLGDYPAAVAVLRAAATTFDQLGDPVNEAAVRNNLGLLLTRMGDWTAAEENLREAVRLARRMAATARLLHPLQNLAELEQSRGDFEQARASWVELLEAARQTGFPEAEAVARSGLGLCLLHSGDLDGALEQSAAAEKLLGDAWDDGREAWHMLAAELAVARGARAAAAALLLDGARALGDSEAFVSARFHLAAGEAMLPDDPPGAALVIGAALATFSRLGAEPFRRRAEALLSTTAR